MSSADMLKRLRPFMRKSKIYEEIYDAEAAQYASRDITIADLQTQLSIDTATWALDIDEKELGITIDASKPYSERRAVIKSKARGIGKIDAVLIKLVLDSWTGGGVDVAFAAGEITITFNDVVGIPENIDDAKLSVEEIKPAHLAVLYVYLYNQYSQLTAYTHDQLAPQTHEQLRSSALP